uniref:Uncharacterized protein n=1 Tax=Ralstonia syzygii R24 TaxID=907261 RepID=G3A7I7_9RALS|nr:hypothetical protein RALSY_40685 [Ralstonia syzygii R24]
MDMVVLMQSDVLAIAYETLEAFEADPIAVDFRPVVGCFSTSQPYGETNR